MAEPLQTSVVQLAEQLSQGFAALSGEYQILFDQQRQLESKLSWAKQQYLDLLKRCTPDTLSQDHRVFLDGLEHIHVASDNHGSPSDWVAQIARNDGTERRDRAVLIKQAESALASLRASTVDSGVKIWSGPSADRDKPTLHIQSNIELSQLEKDFTTTGTPSRLACPFAPNGARQSPLATPRSSTSRMSLKGRRSKRPSFNDPIRAEICGNDLVSTSASASADGSAAVCPIRFLDQHAPEDVAKYFEKHKHELPRSHEVCINRFQSNAESIQQLDRKYGNLVSMIQGLGEKHQAWLPEEPDEGADAPGDEAKADVKVEKWATAVTASLHDCTLGEEEESPNHAVDEARTAHFDRPLKDIRVGESPSRPWGISIPPKYTDAESSSSVGSAPTASPPLPLDLSRPIGETPKRPEQCPFGRAVKVDGSKVQERGPEAAAKQEPPSDAPVSSLEQPTESESELRPDPGQEEQKNSKRKASEPETPKVIPQMIFNGPVFLGYPPDQLVSILQNSNLGAALR